MPARPSHRHTPCDLRQRCSLRAIDSAGHPCFSSHLCLLLFQDHGRNIHNCRRRNATSAPTRFERSRPPNRPSLSSTFMRWSCSPSPHESLFRPWFCTRHLWWSVGAPFLRFKKRTHHSAARGPGMVQSGNSSFCNSLLTSRHRRSSRMTPWNCRPSSRASAETSAPLYAGTSLCFIFRMARCSCATNLRPTDPRRTSDPSSSTASPLLFPPRVSTHVEPREPALQPQPLQGQQVEVPLLAPALLRRRELHLA